MISIKSKDEIKKMEVAGGLLAQILHDVLPLIKPGVSTLHIDNWIAQELKKKGLVSQCQGYSGYQHVSCISINDEVVHGIPSEDKIIQDGDLIKIDVCASWQGLCADLARCYFVGTAGKERKKLVSAAKAALDKGIEQAIPGNRLGDISAAIQKEVEHHGYGVVRDFAGHGIGKKMHEEPEILNYGDAGKGPLLKVGMTFALEPMITMGNFAVYVLDDGWTVKTKDKSVAAHVEDTIAITENGPKILTRTNGFQKLAYEILEERINEA